MIERKSILILLILIAMGSMTACSQNGYHESESGLTYKFHRQADDRTVHPQNTDIVTAKMSYYINDSLLFDSYQMDRPMQFPMIESQFPGDFYQGLAMMSVGDSASFLCPADSVFLKIFRVKNMPEFVKPGAVMRFEIALDNIQSEEEFQHEKMEAMQVQIDESNAKLEAYIAENNISVQPTESGLYFIEISEGNGKKPTHGKKVKVHYTGTLLGGMKFDSSLDRGEPIEFVLGMGQVIAGWDEGISMMEEGGQARLIIPQHLAYKDRAAGIIPAFSPLIFEVELVEIVK